MTLVIGIDEAGYGPNLGPLAIAVSAWQVHCEAAQVAGELDLYRLLRPVVADRPHPERLAVADSKVLYKPGSGLALLERGVLAILGLCQTTLPSCYDTLVEALSADADGRRKELPWHQNGFLPPVPLDSCPHELAAATQLLAAESTAVRIRALRARLVFPAEFNAVCNRHGSKGLALSHWTLGLLKEVLIEISPAPSPQPPVPVHVTCDKHGGRNNYAGLLTEYFPDCRLRVIVESRPRSAYLLTSETTELHIEFRSRGESQLETALASMTAKYLRELSMRALNRFWQSHLANLKPTAGYPVDARRFKAAIEQKQRELAIDDFVLWRTR